MVYGIQEKLKTLQIYHKDLSIHILPKNQDAIFKAFACAYFLGTGVIMGILFSIYSFAGMISLTFVFILAFIVLAVMLGVIPLRDKRLSAVMILFAVISILLLSIYINAPFYQLYNLILIIFFYFFLGFFPAMKWTENTIGKVLTVGLAILIGALVFNIIAIVAVICFGVAKGSFVSLLTSLIIVFFWFMLTGRKGNSINQFIRRHNPTSEDLQLIAIMAMALLTNALFLNYQYPHWHTDHYFTFVKTLLQDDIFNFGSLPGNMAKTAHILSLFVPPIWAKLLHFDIAAATYFELLIGHLSLYIAVYLFVMILFRRHAYALGSLIFIAFLSDLHLYAYGFQHLLHEGKLADFFPLNMETWRSFLIYLRSRLMPLFHPWALTVYIDIVKSYSALLLCIYLVNRQSRDWSAVIYAGLITIIIMGCGEEYLLFTFLLFVPVYLFAHFPKLPGLRIPAGLLIGVLIGFPLYFYLSIGRGALNMLNQGSIFIKKLNEVGVYLFEAGKLSFDWPSIRYLLLDFGYPLIFLILFIIYRCIKRRNVMKEENDGRLILALCLTFILMTFVPVFFGSAGMIHWNLNRFLAPLMFLVYLLAGAGFVYIVTRFKIKSAFIVLLLLVVIFPTLRLAYSSLVFEPVRIADGVETVLGLDKHHFSAGQIIRVK